MSPSSNRSDSEAIAKLDVMIDAAAETAREAFAKNGCVRPLWIAETKGGDMLAIPALLSGKDEMMAALRIVFREKGVVRFVHMDEAWILRVQSDDEIPPDVARGKGSLEHHPDRREVVMLHAEDATHIRMARFYILRPEHGPAALSPLQRDGTLSNFKGRMVGLLK